MKNQKTNITQYATAILMGTILCLIPFFYLLLVGFIWFVYFFKGKSFFKRNMPIPLAQRMIWGLYALLMDSCILLTLQLWVLKSTFSYPYMILASVVYALFSIYFWYMLMLKRIF
jgi:hypothetical protein